MPTEITKCIECPFFEEYNWEGKEKRCKHQRMIKDHGEHGKALPSKITGTPGWCPLPEYDIVDGEIYG